MYRKSIFELTKIFNFNTRVMRLAPTNRQVILEAIYPQKNYESHLLSYDLCVLQFEL